jgi:hypothetical protein
MIGAMVTKLTPMRLVDDDVDLLDALKDKLGLASRTDVVRLAIRRLAEIEGVRSKPKAKGRRNHEE